MFVWGLNHCWRCDGQCKTKRSEKEGLVCLVQNSKKCDLLL